MPSLSLAVDRYLIAAAVVLTCVLFTSQAADPVNVIKLTALTLIAIGLVCSAGYRAIRYRTLHVPQRLTAAVITLLVLALLASAAAAPSTTVAVVGTYGRNSGLMAYLSAIVLFIAGLRVFGRPHARVLVGAVVGAGLFTALYGLLQKAGVDAIAWNNPFNPIIAALGNPNFASGYLGVAAAVGAGGAFYRGWHTAWRLTSATTTILCLLTAALSDSIQGPLAAIGGLLVLGCALSLNLKARYRGWLLVCLASTAASGLIALVMGAILKAGPAAGFFTDIGSQARRYYWSAAIDMLKQEPALGVGLDHYGFFWRATRTSEAVKTLSGANYSDAAHSVPLQMLAQGGTVLGVAYLGFVLLVLVSLIQGLRRLKGDERVLLGALGAGWVAYQVQSLVSIDQVPLLVLHFCLGAGVVVTAAGSPLRVLRLPGAAKPATTQPSDARTKRRLAADSPQTPPLRPRHLIALSAVATVALVTAWFTFIPLRANMAAQEADKQRALGRPAASAAELTHATELMPGQAYYWLKKAQFAQQAEQPRDAEALAALLRAVEADPSDANALISAADLSEKRGDLGLSRELHRRATRVDPVNPATIVANATFELRHRGAADALTLLEKAVVIQPGSADLWAVLGDARAVLADNLGARAAYERALRLQADQPTAIAGLAKLTA